MKENVTLQLPLYLKHYLSHEGLVEKLGWMMYSKSHTDKLCKPRILKSEGSRKPGGKPYRQWWEDNPDPFPLPIKPRGYKTSPKVWYVPDVIAWLRRRGFPVPNDKDIIYCC